MRFVAFLRGINVGGRVIKKDELKACFERLGYTEVTTVLQSGNVIFESTANDTDVLKNEIEAGLTTTFSYPAKVIVHSLDSLVEIVKNYPFEQGQEEYHDYVMFLSSPIGKELLDQSQSDPAVEQMALGNTVVYWKVKKGMTLESPFAVLANKAKYREFTTVRNINTLNKILAK